MALATLSQAGYSVKPLHEKLGYKPGSTVAFVALPDDLAALPASVEFGKVAKRGDWSRPLGPTTYDTIHAFTRSRAELAAGLPKLRKYLNSDGMIWICVGTVEASLLSFSMSVTRSLLGFLPGFPQQYRCFVVCM